MSVHCFLSGFPSCSFSVFLSSFHSSFPLLSPFLPRWLTASLFSAMSLNSSSFFPSLFFPSLPPLRSGLCWWPKLSKKEESSSVELQLRAEHAQERRQVWGGHLHLRQSRWTHTHTQILMHYALLWKGSIFPGTRHTMLCIQSKYICFSQAL